MRRVAVGYLGRRYDRILRSGGFRAAMDFARSKLDEVKRLCASHGMFFSKEVHGNAACWKLRKLLETEDYDFFGSFLDGTVAGVRRLLCGETAPMIRI